MDCGGAYGIAAVVVVVDTPPWDLELDTILVVVVVVVDILAVAWVDMCYYWSRDIVVVNSRTNSVLRVAMIVVVVVVVDLVRNYFDGMVLVLVVVEDNKMMDSSYFQYDYNLG